MIANWLPDQILTITTYSFSSTIPIEIKLCEGVAMRNDEPGNFVRCARCNTHDADDVHKLSIACIRKQVEASRAMSRDNDALPICENETDGHVLTLLGYVNLGC